ncbi:MAG: T9SS type A sorting domain-containing protein [Chitinophagales bacterium]|nr:T9SS type A sorting domain-containing protein [Chitinophagales bacterium]
MNIPFKIKLLLCLVLISFWANSQNLGNYTFPYENKVLSINESNNNNDIKSIVFKVLSLSQYQNLSLNLVFATNSLSAKHYTFQVAYKNIPVEFCWVKVHTSKNGMPFKIQNNIPSKEIWNNFNLTSFNSSENNVLLCQNDALLTAKRDTIINEKADIYNVKYTLNDHSFFENTLKYHSDTTIHAKVFLPDPLTSSNNNYGGLYQDAYAKDTSVLVLQNQSNSSGSTVTFNAINYTIYSQQFNVGTESYVNNYSGNTLYQYFENIYFNGLGGILGYNTAITDNLSGKTTQLITEDYNYPTLANQQAWVNFMGTYNAGTFYLENNAFKITELSAPSTNVAQSNTDTMLFTRNELGFEDINAFYHLNNYRNYWQSLGFTDLDASQISVDTHGNNGADNSFFSPATPLRLIFGEGGVDDAEDADVIIHEYGHAISHFAAPGSNSGSQRNAIDEGFGDYVAVSYSKGYSNYKWNEVFSWDGHNEFWSGRDANSSKTALDISNAQNIYYNGEIWSTVMTDLLLNIGKTNADKFAIELMYYNTPNISIYQSLMNLFTIDSLLFGETYRCDIFNVLFNRKFLVGDCNNFYSDIKESYYNNGEVKLLNSANFSNSTPLKFSIEAERFKEANYQIFNAFGKLVHEESFTERTHTIPTNELSKAIYFIVLQTNNSTYRFKITKR